MPEQTNPARELYEQLRSIASLGDKSPRNSRPSVTAKEVWLGALNISGSETRINRQFYASLDELLVLVYSCEQVVKRSEAMNRSMHLRQLGQIKQFILNVNAWEWREFRSHVNDDFLMSLQWAAQDMSSHWNEEVIPEEELANLQTDVNDIIEKVVSSSLDPNLKSVLLEGLNTVRQAIMDYRVGGAEGIRQAVEKNIGLMHRYREEFKAAGKSNDRQVVADFFAFLKKADIVVSTASKIKQLGVPIIERMLEGGGG